MKKTLLSSLSLHIPRFLHQAVSLDNSEGNKISLNFLPDPLSVNLIFSSFKKCIVSLIHLIKLGGECCFHEKRISLLAS